MELRRLTIDRATYGKDAGRLRGTISAISALCGSDNELKIELPEEIAVQIVRLAAPSLAASVQGSLEALASDAERVMLGDAVEAKAIEDA